MTNTDIISGKITKDVRLNLFLRTGEMKISKVKIGEVS